MELNYLKLYFSLTLTGLTIFASAEGYYSYKAYVLAKEAKAYSIQAQRDAKSAAAREKIRLDKLAKERAHRQQAINNAQRTNNEICSYWTKEYLQNRTEYNKSMKDGACERAMKPPVQSSTPVINLRGN